MQVFTGRQGIVYITNGEVESVYNNNVKKKTIYRNLYYFYYFQVIVVADEVNDEDEEEDDDYDLPLTFLGDECWSKMSISWKMERLRSAKLTGLKFKLSIDQEDILTDAVVFYKCPSFDPTRPLRVSFNDQLAIDTGGVLREFFSTVKEKFISEGVFKMFEGPHQRLLFNYEQSCHAAEIPKILGKLVAHSLVHGCGGFPHLAPAHYYYIATGDIQQAAAYASVCDVYDTEKRDILDKVMNHALCLCLSLSSKHL